MASLRQRVRRPELMDSPDLDAAEHFHALKWLNRSNRWLGAERRLYREVAQLGPPAEMSVLDLGAGGGGFLTYLAHRRGRPHTSSSLIALDCSPRALGYARQQADSGLLGVVADVRQLPFAAESVDVVVCSLVLHHFSDADVTIILREAARVCRRGIVVSDLVRSYLGLAATWLTTHVISRSHVFHVDGVRSVQAAFQPRELASLAQKAGLNNAAIHRSFPFRALLSWSRK